MDVHCSSCNEAWDVYHLRHDIVYEIGLTEEKADAWRTLSAKQRLAVGYRERFKASGWEFGASILDVRHCPACPSGAKPDIEKVAIKDAVVEALGDDEDGIASTMEDFGL
jgi:hypothetical protein